jgi:spore coat-associated protein N
MSRHRATRAAMSLRVKLLSSAALLAAAAGAAGLGTFGSFTSTTSASEAVSAGTVSIALGTAGTSANRLTVAATGVVPGDTIQRAATLTNAVGNQSLASISLTTAATPATTLLTTDTTNGLQTRIDKCSVAWTEAGAGTEASPYTYTCSGTTTAVLAQRAIVGINLTLSGLSTLAPGTTDYLRVMTTLPVTADNTFQGLTTSVAFTFTGTQRASTSQ